MTIRDFVPREHGAWAMWIVPMLSAAVVTSFSLNFFLILTCFTLLYIVHHPIVLMAKRKRVPGKGELKSVIIVATPGLLLGLALVMLAGRVWLLAFGVTEGAVFLFSVRTFIEREQRSFLNELLIVFSLTLSAPAAYYAITGLVDLKAAVLFALNFLFFGSSVFFVKMKIEFLRTKGTWGNGAKQALVMMIVYHMLLVAIVLSAGAFGVVNPWIMLGYVPMLVQVVAGSLSKETKINFMRLGVMLVVQSVIFLTAVGLFLR